MCSLKIALCSVSGPRSMIRSASAEASATDSTGSPAVSAFATDDEPSRRPDAHVDAGVLQVQGVGVALASRSR